MERFVNIIVLPMAYSGTPEVLGRLSSPSLRLNSFQSPILDRKQYRCAPDSYDEALDCTCRITADLAVGQVMPQGMREFLV